MQTITITDQDGNSTTTMFRDGDTLGETLTYFGYDTSNLVIKVNGNIEPLSYELKEGDDIDLSAKKKISGRA